MEASYCFSLEWPKGSGGREVLGMYPSLIQAQGAVFARMPEAVNAIAIWNQRGENYWVYSIPDMGSIPLPAIKRWRIT